MHLSSPSHAPPNSYHPSLPLSLSLPAHAPGAGTNKKHALLGYYTILDYFFIYYLLFIIYCTIAQKSVVWGFIFPSNFLPKIMMKLQLWRMGVSE